MTKPPMDLNQATTNLTEAMLLVREAAEAYVKEYGTDLRGLMKLVNSNQSGWSGGPSTVTNIVEATIRAKAMEEMERQINRVPSQDALRSVVGAFLQLGAVSQKDYDALRAAYERTNL